MSMIRLARPQGHEPFRRRKHAPEHLPPLPASQLDSLLSCQAQLRIRPVPAPHPEMEGPDSE